MNRQKIKGFLLRLLKQTGGEILAVSLVFLVATYYTGFEKILVMADGEGYYDYLPSVFIHHDINRHEASPAAQPEKFSRISSKGFYLPAGEGMLVNKYPCGTALLQSPFFLYSWFTHPAEPGPNDGYQDFYQESILYAAGFYLFLALFFLRKLLGSYGIGPWIILLSQLLTALATSVFIYTVHDPAFSHIYSFFAVTAFFYFTKTYFDKQTPAALFRMLFFLGLVALLRNFNLIAVFFVPFLAGSFANLKQGILGAFRLWKALAGGLLACLALISIQSVLWYLQSGRFFIYSYGEERFYFSEPHLADILFSYQKGLFVYAPVLFLSLFGLLFFLARKQFYLFLCWTGFFLLLAYVLSCWWAWWFGGSFGHRAFIDFYAIFFLLFGLLMQQLNRVLRWLTAAAALACIPFTLLQSYQYHHFILHWSDMNEEKYWKVFLHTEDHFRGILWKRAFDLEDLEKKAELHFPDREIPAGDTVSVAIVNSRDIPGFIQTNIIRLELDNEFRSTDDARMEVNIRDSATNIYYFGMWPLLLHFADGPLDSLQSGYYPAEIPPQDSATKFVEIRATAGKLPIRLRNLKLVFYSIKNP